MKNCIHHNTVAAPAIASTSVWCPDCKKWVQLFSGSRPVMGGTHEKDMDTGEVTEPLTKDISDFPPDLESNHP